MTYRHFISAVALLILALIAAPSYAAGPNGAALAAPASEVGLAADYAALNSSEDRLDAAPVSFLVPNTTLGATASPSDAAWYLFTSKAAETRERHEFVRVFAPAGLSPVLADFSVERIAVEPGASATSFVADGFVGTQQVVEDTRVFREGRNAYVVRDLYLGYGFNADLVGRGIPVRIAGSVSATAPAVTSISGKSYSSTGVDNGKISQTCGQVYNGFRVIDTTWSGSSSSSDSSYYPWTIHGRGFGSTRGTLSVVTDHTPVSVRITSWSDTTIVAQLTMAWDSTTDVAVLDIRTASNTRVAYAVSAAPAIRSRVEGQCTYWVARKRIEYGLRPSPGAYDGSSITASWVPRKGDQLVFSGHVGILSSVGSRQTRSNGRYAYWAVTVTEMNPYCDNRSYSKASTFEVDTVTHSVTLYPRSTVNNVGVATKYYR